MRLVTTAQMRAADNYTINEIGLPAIVLMEEAGRQVAELCLKLIKKRQGRGRVFVWAGRGNNGGDGFVVARRLGLAGYHTEVFLVCPDPNKIVGPARRNLDILRRLKIAVNQAWSSSEIAAAGIVASSGDVQVDALLGTGSRGMLSGPLGEAVSAMNLAKVPTVSIDLPSGLNADSGEVSGPVVNADVTVAIGKPKTGLLTHPGAAYAGELHVADIGIPPQAYVLEGPETVFVQKSDVLPFLPIWSATAHKGDRGRVFIAGGSPGLIGAACLAAQAALRSGAGLVTLGVPAVLHDLVEIKLTEVMTTALPQTDSGTIATEALPTLFRQIVGIDALAVGPGLGRHEQLADVMVELIRSTRIPTVVDADGLNALQGRTNVLSTAKAPLILTPHPGEMARLCGTSAADVQARRLPLARFWAKEWGVWLVLKGSRTIIAGPEGDCYINSTGGPTLATGGSGDALTGIITGLLAQGLAAKEAAIAGVFIHGLTATEAAQVIGGDHGVVAGDLIDALPRTLKGLFYGA